MPSRNARHGHAFTNEGVRNMLNAKYTLDDQPIDPTLRLLPGSSLFRAYIHHLFKAGEMLAMRLTVMHNLLFLQQFDGTYPVTRLMKTGLKHFIRSIQRNLTKKNLREIPCNHEWLCYTGKVNLVTGCIDRVLQSKRERTTRCGKKTMNLECFDNDRCSSRMATCPA